MYVRRQPCDYVDASAGAIGYLSARVRFAHIGESCAWKAQLTIWSSDNCNLELFIGPKKGAGVVPRRFLFGPAIYSNSRPIRAHCLCRHNDSFPSRRNTINKNDVRVSGIRALTKSPPLGSISEIRARSRPLLRSGGNSETYRIRGPDWRSVGHRGLKRRVIS